LYGYTRIGRSDRYGRIDPDGSGRRQGGVVRVLAAIVICEIAFWVVLAAGLVVRYLVRWKRTSTVLLASTPAIDVVLLVLTFVDLAAGGQSSFFHGLSAFYIGFSVTHGPRTVAWADAWAAHRWDGAPRPEKTVRYGAEELAHQWREFRRTCVASAIAGAVLVVGLFVADPGETFWLIYWLITLVSVVLVWLLIGPVRSIRRPARPEHADARR
jgi:hypothetical protein